LLFEGEVYVTRGSAAKALTSDNYDAGRDA